MLNPLANWLDDRTGLLTAIGRVMHRPVRGGARWGHALGFALAATLAVDLVTGLLLMATYSPSGSTAWGSVYFISYRMELGWFVRGVHRYASYASVVLGALFLARLVFIGACRAPREIHWWLAVGAFLLILGLGVTGNILPWDQRGYWAAVVETTIAGGTPVAGPAIKKVIVGGSEFGIQTVTRFYALHVALLPGLLVLVGWAYAVLFGKRGYHGPEESPRTEPYWPTQAFFDVVLAFAVLGAICGLTVYHHGYSLDAPADPASDDYPARPEWYFLPLNQLLHVFEGREYIATMILPGGVVTGLFLLPLLAKILPKRLAHVAACSFIVTVGGIAGFLLAKGLYEDSKSREFAEARSKADAAASRAIELAGLDGIPPEGSAYVLKLDPLSRGAEVFGKKCQGCHALGERTPEKPSAPDLAAYGSRAWLRGLLEEPGSAHYFGNSLECGGMQKWKKGSQLSGEELDKVADYMATFAQIPADATPAEWLADPSVQAHPGRELFEGECVECHNVGDREAKTQPAPDLFAWGSDRWTKRMIREPASASHYGYLKAKQKMPAFGNQLTEADLSTLVRFLKGDYRKPAGAVPSIDAASRVREN